MPSMPSNARDSHNVVQNILDLHGMRFSFVQKLRTAQAAARLLRRGNRKFTR
jgi:hypothetical protein